MALKAVSERLKLALDKARECGAEYADIRFVRRRSQRIRIKNGVVSAIDESEDQGAGVRAMVDGSWGFASSSKVTASELQRIVELAVRIARSSASVRGGGATLCPAEPVEGSYRTRVATDPFGVKLEEKLETLLDAERRMRADPRIRVSQASMSISREEKLFASTEGSFVEQQLVHTGAGLEATAVDGGEVQTRSYPAGFGGNYAQKGYEYIDQLQLPEHAERVGREAVELLSADQCPSETTTVILDSSQMALQIHESCGHPVELDRALGYEASFAGTSFLTPDLLGTYRYGSPEVTIVGDATLEGGPGSYGYDDEGVPAGRVTLVEEGIFAGYLSSRETAARLSGVSNGAMRADGWNRIPLVRMTNVNLEPGDWSLDEMIRDTRRGIYLETNRSWSIDDKRLNFQFGTEVAREIVDGSLGRLLKNATYTGVTPGFWRGCDAVGGKGDWKLWGLPNCGKGEPMQLAYVGHGTPPARFRKVEVGLGKW